MVIISGLLMPPFPDQGMFWHLFEWIFPATNAFDDGGNTGDSRWLAHGNQLPNVWISYDFLTEPKFMHILYSRKVGGFHKEHRKIGQLQVPGQCQLECY